jgi:hypothetical protein
MTRSIVLALAFLALLLLSAGVVAQDAQTVPEKSVPTTKAEPPTSVRPTAKPAKSQVADGMRVTLVRVARQAVWKDKWMPVEGKAEPGHEFVVVELKFQLLTPTNNGVTEVENLEIEGADGTWYSSGVKTLMFSSSEYVQEIPFHVPEGLKLRTLRVANVAFDLGAAPARRRP